MVKQRISISFSRYTDANFDAKAKHIVESMTFPGNTLLFALCDGKDVCICKS